MISTESGRWMKECASVVERSLCRMLSNRLLSFRADIRALYRGPRCASLSHRRRHFGSRSDIWVSFLRRVAFSKCEMRAEQREQRESSEQEHRQRRPSRIQGKDWLPSSPQSQAQQPAMDGRVCYVLLGQRPELQMLSRTSDQEAPLRLEGDPLSQGRVSSQSPPNRRPPTPLPPPSSLALSGRPQPPPLPVHLLHRLHPPIVSPAGHDVTPPPEGRPSKRREDDAVPLLPAASRRGSPSMGRPPTRRLSGLWGRDASLASPSLSGSSLLPPFELRGGVLRKRRPRDCSSHA